MTEHTLTQAQDHDRRIGRLEGEGIAEQLDRRLDSLERAVAELRAELRASHRWTIGILFGIVGLQITILMKVLN